jgi:hypothetical protein
LSSKLYFEDIAKCMKLNYSRYLNTTIVENYDDMANNLILNDIQRISI